MSRLSIALVTPALASANNGNWQTARRWAQLLAPHCDVRLTDRWTCGDEQLMLALHAKRSAASILDWRNTYPTRPLVVVLTGTDLYGAIGEDPTMQQSLALADRLLVLNRLGKSRLPEALQTKTDLCLPSCSERQPRPKTVRHLRVVMAGHLREEKSPHTYFEAARHLKHRDDILLDHVGAALDPALGDAARKLERECPNYRWLGRQSHEQTRRRIQAAHLLVHPSRVEGGATVIVEAVRSGTPVIASRIDGNLGLLGSDYAGYFEWGNAAALAAALMRARDDAAFLARLDRQCKASARLFAPEQERRSLLGLISTALGTRIKDKPV